ncbi:MAG TPA: molybdopterin cofactor-binding domain-containing protein [Terriglobia bacterium]|nr:molybdopterin cofactor-binding domain-containing protein [Terriglobia bacterium]
MTTQLDRRSFIKLSALAGGGFLVGVTAEPPVLAQGPAQGTDAPVDPNVYITVHPDNTFTVLTKNPETGQGMRNSLAMLIAEELDVDWKQVKYQQADCNPDLYGRQIEGGSTATPTGYIPMRNVGAAARMMMVATAAKRWSVPAADLKTAGGAVTHTASGRTATYASLAADAMKLPAMAVTEIKLKDPKDFKILGKRTGGVDNPAIVTGKPSFSIDVNPPGMLYAVYEKCPVFGGKVVSANIADVKKQPGVKHAFIVPPPGPDAPATPTWASGVAIVAETWWHAQNARKALKIVWDEGAVASQSSAGYMAQIKGLAAKASTPPAGGGQRAAKEGDVEAAFKTAAKIIEAEYDFPLIAHAPLEPQNSTAWFRDGKIEIWSPAQIPLLSDAAVPAGVKNSDVTFHMVRAGGGFGRRLYKEYDIEVSRIARMLTDERTAAGLPSVPVKLLWSREDDMAHDDYRPAGYHYFKAGLDANGKLIAFRDYVASYGATSVVPANEFPKGFVPNFWVSDGQFKPFDVPTGALRAPASNAISFVMQSFIDEVAIGAGKDPLQYRLDLLNSPSSYAAPVGRQAYNASFNAARAKGVLEAVREMSDWNNRSNLPKGTGKGVAFQFAHNGYVAYVVQVTVDSSKHIRVDKAWVAVDIGEQVINPSSAENLVQGGLIEGMSHLMAWEITIDKGRVVQGNFDKYQPTRMAQLAPDSVEVKFLKTDYTPTGLGEPSLPPAPPAICNAIYAATGVRIRALPLAKQGYRWS